MCMFTTAVSDNSSQNLPDLVSRRRMLSLAISGAALLTVKGSLAEEFADPGCTGEAIRPFRVRIPEADLRDLRLRLRQTRWPEKETVGDWSQGVPLQKAKDLVTAWEKNYDWRIFERRINRLPQFLTKIDGGDIHFIHVKSANANALPILLTHGRPGSFAEFLDCIGPLTDPVRHGGQGSDAFDVIIPSLPGYGFSGKPTGPGWNVEKTARAWVTLMERLG